MTWIVLYGGLGYAFGSQWELINDFMAQFSGFILSLVDGGGNLPGDAFSAIYSGEIQ